MGMDIKAMYKQFGNEMFDSVNNKVFTKFDVQ